MSRFIVATHETRHGVSTHVFNTETEMNAYTKKYGICGCECECGVDPLERHDDGHGTIEWNWDWHSLPVAVETHDDNKAEVLVGGTVYRTVISEGDTELEVRQNAMQEWSALTGGNVECAFVDDVMYLNEGK